MTTQTLPTSSERLQSLQQNAVILTLERGILRTRKRINSNAVQSDADPDVLHVAKDILESEQLKAIAEQDRIIGNYVKARSLPSPFKSGFYLLPVRLVSEVVDQLDQLKAERETLVKIFLASYERAKDNAEAGTDEIDSIFTQAKEKLGSLYNPQDYPAVEKVREKFFMTVQILELQTPGKLKAISKDLYEREVAKMESVWEDASAKIVNILLCEFQELTSHLVDRLTPDAGGEEGKKKKALRTSTVKNLNDWLGLFDARNLANDDSLKALVQKARLAIAGIDAEDLREDDTLKAVVAEQFSKIKDEIDQAVIAAPQRRIDFDV